MQLKALVIDDSNTIRLQLYNLLAKTNDFQVELAENGKQGLDILREKPGFDVVLVDINMPEMGGFEFLSVVQSEKLTAAPIIIITTEGKRDMIAKAKELGASGWQVKPFDPDRLLENIERLLISGSHRI